MLVTWHVYPDGVHVWTDGKLVAVIPAAQFPALILACARELQSTR